VNGLQNREKLKNKIILWDFINEVREIKNESIDIIIADPPYNIGKNFGNNKDNLPMKDYLLWTKQWFNECLRVIKPTGTIYI
jgi:site-specific DNA-methyltransferase (adenine-specific)